MLEWLLPNLAQTHGLSNSVLYVGYEKTLSHEAGVAVSKAQVLSLWEPS